MERIVNFIKLLALMMVVTCGINSLLTLLHVLPKEAAARTGVAIREPGPSKAGCEKRDMRYPDFWYVDQVPC
jgi:hypothetical protein